MKLILCDKNPEVLAAWREQFEETPNVEVREEDILETQASAILLPGNSFGYLDSGLPPHGIDSVTVRSQPKSSPKTNSSKPVSSEMCLAKSNPVGRSK